jgi:DNA-binding CsgD family transcriptional regulator
MPRRINLAWRDRPAPARIAASSADVSGLTEREVKVLRQVASGRTNISEKRSPGT